MRFSVGQELEGLEFLRTLQPSKNSVAYVVRDAISQRLEYLKLVPDSLLQDEQTLRRFMREAKVHAGLSHPNIAQFYSVRRLDGELVMTREWVDGETLASKLEHGPLPLLQALDYINQALEALDYAHGRGVVHRDISSHKLLVTESGIVKLTGFDLARGSFDPRLTGTGVVMGSAHYMAPEQVKGLSEADHRSDLYACGVVLFELVTGRRPFERKTDLDVMLAQVEAPPPPPRKWNELIPEALERVIFRALEKDPERRFQSAGEFREELHQVAGLEMDRRRPRFLDEEPGADVVEGRRTSPPPAVVCPLAAGPAVQSGDWAREPADIYRLLGLAIAAFSVGVLVFLGALILMNR